MASTLVSWREGVFVRSVAASQKVRSAATTLLTSCPLLRVDVSGVLVVVVWLGLRPEAAS